MNAYFLAADAGKLELRHIQAFRRSRQGNRLLIVFVEIEKYLFRLG